MYEYWVANYKTTDIAYEITKENNNSILVTYYLTSIFAYVILGTD